MEHVESEIYRSGYKKIYLRASLNAVAFYERLGYHFVTEDQMNLDGLNVRVVRMEKG